MAANEIHLGDVGTVFTYTVLKADGTPEDLSGVTIANQRFVFTKPSGARLVVTPAFVTDGTDGQLRYTTVAGDIDELGAWFYHPRISGLSSWSGAADIIAFTVHGNL